MLTHDVKPLHLFIRKVALDNDDFGLRDWWQLLAKVFKGVIICSNRPKISCNKLTTTYKLL